MGQRVGTESRLSYFGGSCDRWQRRGRGLIQRIELFPDLEHLHRQAGAGRPFAVSLPELHRFRHEAIDSLQGSAQIQVC